MLLRIVSPCKFHNRRRGRVVRAWDTLIMLTLRRSEGREFDPRPGQYSRMSFSSDQVTGTVFPHLNMPFLPNSKFIYNIVLVGKQKLQSISTFLYNIEVTSHLKNCHSGHILFIRSRMFINPPHILFYLIFLQASFGRCFFLDRSLAFS